MPSERRVTVDLALLRELAKDPGIACYDPDCGNPDCKPGQRLREIVAEAEAQPAPEPHGIAKPGGGDERDRGLYPKYVVLKDGQPIRGAAFTLRPGKDPAASIAMRSYIDALPDCALRRDLVAWDHSGWAVRDEEGPAQPAPEPAADAVEALAVVLCDAYERRVRGDCAVPFDDHGEWTQNGYRDEARAVLAAVGGTEARLRAALREAGEWLGCPRITGIVRHKALETHTCPACSALALSPSDAAAQVEALTAERDALRATVARCEALTAGWLSTADIPFAEARRTGIVASADARGFWTAQRACASELREALTVPKEGGDVDGGR